jgi:excisionase family DNA binding protein
MEDREIFDREVLDKKQAARFLGISMPYLEKLMRTRRIPYSKIDGRKGRVLFLKADLIEWVKQHRVKGPETE